MKIKLEITLIIKILFLLVSFSENRLLFANEESLSQNSLREKYPFQISVFATTRSPRDNGFIDLHLGYNIKKNLTLGISVYTLYPEVISVQGFNQTILERYEKKNTQEILYLFAHYFPFGGGFYLSGVIGRYPGVIEKHTELLSFQNGNPSIYQTNAIPYSRPLLSYTVTYDPRYNIGIGLGYKWIFQNGFFLGADYGITEPNPVSKNIYIEKDFRDLARSLSLQEYVILKKQLEWETHSGNFDNGLKLTYFVNVHFGVSF